MKNRVHFWLKLDRARLFGKILLNINLNRYVIQLLTPASILARINGRNMVEKQDIEEVHGLFFDAKTSAKHLQTTQDKFIK